MREALLLSLRLRPVTIQELLIFRFLSRVGCDHSALFRSVARLRLLRCALGSHLGLRAAIGMATAETGLLLLIAARPAETPGDMRRKALLVRAFMEADPDGNVGPMLAAGLEADARRLGLLVEDDRVDAVASVRVH